MRPSLGLPSCSSPGVPSSLALCLATLVFNGDKIVRRCRIHLSFVPTRRPEVQTSGGKSAARRDVLFRTLFSVPSGRIRFFFVSR